MEVSFLPHPLTITLLILMNLCSATSEELVPTETTDNEFIKTTCRTTTYPDLCFTSLSSYATVIHGSRKLMTITALSVAVTRTCSASSIVANLTKTNALKPREASALSDCIEELGDSVEELQKSVAELKGNDRAWLQTGDIQTWVSAALTDEDTCMEGFAGETMNCDVKDSVRALVIDVAHLTSNALSLVSQLKQN